MGIRRTIGRLGVHSRLFRLGHNARQLAYPELRILAYHRVIAPTHAYDRENVSADLESFEWQMRFIRRNYCVISFAELQSAINRAEVLPKRCAMITFDDGFADNYFNAFPILKELQMPALFNVVTSTIGSERMFWFDRAACLVRSAENGQSLRFGEFNLVTKACNRDAGTAALLQFLKDQPDDVRQEHVKLIDKQLRCCMPSPAELASHYPLNWEQILLMSSAGMEFGSHTHTHPILAKLADTNSIDHELRHSRELIERHTGKPCIALAYPEGLDYAFDQRVIDSAGRAGYEFALTSKRGVNRLPLTARHEMERIQIHHSNDRTLFEASVQFPELVI